MRQFLRVFLVLATVQVAVSAQAACFKFINGKAPTHIGSIKLFAPPTDVCVSPGDSDYVVEFKDAEGVLAQFGAYKSRSCTTTECGYGLNYGNSNGENVDGNGTIMTIVTDYQPNILMSTGALYLQSQTQNEAYNLIETKGR